MTELVRPDLRLSASLAAAVSEFGAEQVHGSGLPSGVAVDLGAPGAATSYVAERLRFADPDAELPAGMVPCDFLWMVEGDEVVGFLALRHRLNAWLLEEGGHIGYSVRPSRRRQGHARRALAAALVRAAERGLGRVLITCDEDNLGSRATIEGAGGDYEDSRRGKRRYWVELADTFLPPS